jgi:tetratricopeptide (TPR) repeat protein
LSDALSLSQFRKHIDGAGNSDSDYSKERWAPAVELYGSLVRTEPNIGRAWFNLGYALHFSHQHTRAITAFERALGLGYSKPNTAYNIACAYAMLNQKDAAFEWLDRAITAGFDSYGNLTRDRDLNNLKSDPRFKRFVDKAKLRDKEKSKEMSW